MALFERFAWPGNFRQLANVLRTAAAMADGEAQIRPEHLPDDFFEDLHDDVRLAGDADSDIASRSAGRLREATTSLIDAALARNDGNVSAAARELGVSRNVIYRQMRRRQSSDQTRPTDR
jgi:transcriptional regulator of acetoin/glycerol metabolism